MSQTSQKSLILSFALLILALVFSACTAGNPPLEDVTPEAVEPTISPTPADPTPTLVPAAAVVNGESIPLAWFEAEVSRYLLAMESQGEPVEDLAAARERVLNDLIDQLLLAQGAQEAGLTVTDGDVAVKLDALALEVDLPAWMAQWGYADEDLAFALKWQMLAALGRDQVIDAVPEIMEQVELRQVFAYTEAGAKDALLSLNSGKAFTDEAFRFDPVAGGYLGWAPRGYLLIPAVEEAAFTLPVGNHSEIIESEIGYHIVQVLAREERSLSPDAMLTLQREALGQWVADRRISSDIEVIDD